MRFYAVCFCVQEFFLFPCLVVRSAFAKTVAVMVCSSIFRVIDGCLWCLTIVAMRRQGRFVAFFQFGFPGSAVGSNVLVVELRPYRVAVIIVLYCVGSYGYVVSSWL